MQTIQNGTRGLGLLLILNWDRLFMIGAIWTALALSTWLRLI